MCFFKVRNMWIGHIILIHSNPQESRVHRGLMRLWCYVRHVLFIWSPGSHLPYQHSRTSWERTPALLCWGHWQIVVEMFLKQNSPLSFQCKFAYLDRIFSRSQTHTASLHLNFKLNNFEKFSSYFHPGTRLKSLFLPFNGP